MLRDLQSDRGSAVFVVILTAMLVAIAVLVAAGGRAVLQDARVDTAADAAAHAGITAAFDYANDIVPDQVEIDAAEKAANPSEPTDPLDPEPEEPEERPVPKGQIPMEREQLVLRWMAAAFDVGELTPVETREFSQEFSQLENKFLLLAKANEAANWVIGQTPGAGSLRSSKIGAESDGTIYYQVTVEARKSTGASQSSAGIGAGPIVEDDTVEADASARAEIVPRGW